MNSPELSSHVVHCDDDKVVALTLAYLRAGTAFTAYWDDDLEVWVIALHPEY